MINWWQGAVIYQIYPRSFADANGDGVGDLRGITDHLDHVASLGVDGIWISPFFTSPMHDFGYDVADFCDVDPVFGCLQDFKDLMTKAHSLGLKVIIDQVYSHVSIDHPWFKESQKAGSDKADWFVWGDAKADGTPPNNWQSVFSGPAWSWSTERGQYYMHTFLKEQPDLNLHTPAVQAAILDVAKFWLDLGVDGFRLDAANHYMHDPQLRDNPPFTAAKAGRPFEMQDHLYNQSHPAVPAFLEKLRAVLDDYGAIFTVAEVGGRRSLEEMAEYTKGEGRLNTAYSFIFLEQEELSAASIQKAFTDWTAATDSWPSWTFSNHDRMRVVTRWGAGRDPKAFAKQMNMMLTSLRGILFMYQGEELGLPQANVPFEKLQDPEAIANWPHSLGRDGVRTPIPWSEEVSETEIAGWTTESWLPMDAAHIPLNIAAQEKDAASVLQFTRQLLSWRQSVPAMVKGDQTFIDAGHKDILAFRRTLDGEDYLCVFNLGHETLSWDQHQCDVVFSVNVDTADMQTLPVCGAYIAKL